MNSEVIYQISWVFFLCFQGHFIDVDLEEQNSPQTLSKALLVSPKYPASPQTMCLHFWYVMDGTDQGKSISQPINHLINKPATLLITTYSISQSIRHSLNQPIIQSTSHSAIQSVDLVNQPVNKLTGQPINH